MPAFRAVFLSDSRSHLGRFKPIADYDWNWPKQIDRPAIESALRLDFLDGVAHLPHLEADPATLEKIEAFVAQFA